MNVTAIVLAGGSGTRFGAPLSKVYVDLGGRPVLAHSLATFDDHDGIDHVVVVIRDGDQDAYDAVARAAPVGKVRAVVPGGDTRMTSEWAGIQAVAAAVPQAGLVLLHDAARPLASPELITALVAAAGGDGAIPGVPVTDDLVDVEGTPVPSSELVAVQTPQAFHLDALLDVYPRAIADHFSGLDTAEAMATYGHTDVVVVPSTDENLKITHPDDLQRAAAVLGDRTVR